MPEEVWETYKPISGKEAETLRQKVEAFEWKMCELDNLRRCQDNQRILEKNSEEAENLWFEMTENERFYYSESRRRTYYKNNKIRFEYSRLRKLLGPLGDNYSRYDLEWVCRNCKTLKKFSDKMKKNSPVGDCRLSLP